MYFVSIYHNFTGINKGYLSNEDSFKNALIESLKLYNPNEKEQYFFDWLNNLPTELEDLKSELINAEYSIDIIEFKV